MWAKWVLQLKNESVRRALKPAYKLAMHVGTAARRAHAAWQYEQGQRCCGRTTARFKPSRLAGHQGV